MIVAPWVAGVLTYLLHSTLWVAGASLLAARLAPRARNLLWRLALVGPLLSVGVQVLAGPAWTIRPGWLAPAKPAVAESPVGEDWATLADPGEPREQSRDPGDSFAPTISDSGESRSSSLPPWWALALALLLGGRLALGARRLARLRRLLADRRPVRDEGMLARLERLRASLRRPRRVRLTISDATASPVALWGDEICLPARAQDDLDARALTAVLAHELAHLERRDNLWLAIAAAVDGVFFFQPLNRLARRRLQDSAELAADERAVELTEDPLGLARSLTDVASWGIDGPALALASAMARRSALRARVEQLLGPRARRSRAGIAAVGCLGVLALLTPAVALEPPPAPEPAPPPPSAGWQAPPTKLPAPAAAPAPPAAKLPPVLAPAPPDPPAKQPRAAAPPSLPAKAPRGADAAAPPATAPAPPSPPAPAPSLPPKPAHLAAPRPPRAPRAPRPPRPPRPARVTPEGPRVGWPATPPFPPIPRVAWAQPVPPVPPMPPMPPMPRMAFGPRRSMVFALTGKDGRTSLFSGSSEDLSAAKVAAGGAKEYLWVRRGDRQIVITSAPELAALGPLAEEQDRVEDKQRTLGVEMAELGKRQAALGVEQAELGKSHATLGVEQANVHSRRAQLAADRARVELELRRTMSKDREAKLAELGRREVELGGKQSELGRKQSELGHKQGEIGHKQGEIGRQQGDIGRQQRDLARSQREMQMRTAGEIDRIVERALSQGTARVIERR